MKAGGQDIILRETFLERNGKMRAERATIKIDTDYNHIDIICPNCMQDVSLLMGIAICPTCKMKYRVCRDTINQYNNYLKYLETQNKLGCLTFL